MYFERLLIEYPQISMQHVIRCDLMRKQDVTKHCKMQGHQDSCIKFQSRLKIFLSSDEVLKWTEAEWQY